MFKNLVFLFIISVLLIGCSPTSDVSSLTNLFLGRSQEQVLIKRLGNGVCVVRGADYVAKSNGLNNLDYQGIAYIYDVSAISAQKQPGRFITGIPKDMEEGTRFFVLTDGRILTNGVTSYR